MMSFRTMEPPLPVFFCKYFSGLSLPVSLLYEKAEMSTLFAGRSSWPPARTLTCLSMFVVSNADPVSANTRGLGATLSVDDIVCILCK